MENKILIKVLLISILGCYSRHSKAVSSKNEIALIQTTYGFLQELSDSEEDGLVNNEQSSFSNDVKSKSSANNDQLTKEQFEYLIDYANCNYVNFSLSKVRGNILCNCNSSDINFNNIISKIPEGQNMTKELANEIEKIKIELDNNFYDKVTLVEILTEDIFEDPVKYKILYEFYKNNHKKPGFNNAKDKIKSFSFKKLNNTDSHKSNNNTITNTTSNNQNKMTLKNFLLIFNTIISLTAILLFLIKFLKNDDDTNEHKSNNENEIKKNFKINIKDPNLINLIDVKIENSKLKQEVIKLHTEIEKNSKSIESIQKIIGSVLQEGSIAEVAKSDLNKPPIDRKEIKYANGCEEDGGFKMQNLTDEVQHNSCYIIEITNLNAVFSVIDSLKAFEAISQYPTYRLDPVCDVVLGNINGASKIKTLTPGNLMLEGDTWKLKTKAKVSYE